MPDPTASGNPQSDIFSQRILERITACLFILYCILQVVSVATRVSSGADQEDALSSILMISVNHSWYLTNKIVGLAAAFVLVALAAFSYPTFSRHSRYLGLLAAVFLLTGGIMGLVSGLAGLALAQEYGQPAPGAAFLTASNPETVYAALEPLRALAGRAGFTAVALALLALSSLIALVKPAKPALRWVGWLGWPVGLLMLFIWIPEATFMHRLGGVGLLVWLLLAAVWLLWNGTANPASPKNTSITGEN